MKKEHIVIPCIAIGGDDGEVEIIKNGGPKFGALLQGIKKSLSEARKEAVKKGNFNEMALLDLLFGADE